MTLRETRASQHLAQRDQFCVSQLAGACGENSRARSARGWPALQSVAVGERVQQRVVARAGAWGPDTTPYVYDAPL